MQYPDPKDVILDKLLKEMQRAQGEVQLARQRHVETGNEVNRAEAAYRNAQNDWQKAVNEVQKAHGLAPLRV